jgi:PAS domain S-box-containing protein
LNGAIKVNFHCHSNYSDGVFPPDKVASILAASDVRYAALVDHDTLDGQAAFRLALQKRQIGYLSGVELSVQENGKPIHILGYGFELNNAELKATLQALKKNQQNTNTLSASEVISVLHRAGGKAFLAHPFSYGFDEAGLDALLAALRATGLDGLEVYYAAYSPVQQARLAMLAEKHQLLASAGSDFHSPYLSAVDEAFVECPWSAWVDFRNALALTSTFQRRKPDRGGYVAWAAARVGHRIRQQAEKPNFRKFAFRIFLPAIMTIAVFAFAFWLFVIPAFEAQLLDRKREMIRELTNSAWSVLAKYHTDETNGLLESMEAQRRALAEIGAIRYGDEQKDYFWVTDLKPKMLMHPYRLDLNGTDVSNFQDSAGKRVFVEFVETVKKQESGYVDYRWQWKDNADKIVPKESYVKLFKPWGWVIGTGIYIQDVQQEISRIERKIVVTSLSTLVLVAFLMIYILRQSLGLEEQRVVAVNALKDSHERYRALVEASNEGSFMVVENKCVFSSRKFLEMLDYNEREMASLGLPELVYSGEEWERLNALIVSENSNQREAHHRLEIRLKNRSGQPLDVFLSLTPIVVDGKNGFVFTARDARGFSISASISDPSRERMLSALDFVRVGILRVGASKSMPILDANVAAKKMLAMSAHQSLGDFELAHVFSGRAVAADFYASFLENGVAKTKIEKSGGAESLIILEVEARQVLSETNEVLFGLVTIEDVTEREIKERERESLLEDLRLLYTPFVSSIEKFARRLPVLSMALSCRQAASLASSGDSEIYLVSDHSSERIVGYVNRKILLEVSMEFADGLGQKSIYEVMRAPVPRLSEGASLSEAMNILGANPDGLVLLANPVNGEWRGLTVSDFFRWQPRSVGAFEQDYEKVERLELLPNVHEKHQALLLYGFESGSDPSAMTRLISRETDLVLNRIFSLAFRDMGRAPVSFAFVALGSQGRMEQTFRTDQDNAIVFSDVPKEQRKDVEAYFVRLGEFVCSALDQVGYPFCKGNVMARNPRWVMSLSDWVKTFSGWIRVAEPQALLEFNMFFDFRSVYGEALLVAELRKQISLVMDETPTFFMHLAENAMRYKPPISFFGNLIVGEDVESPSTLNVKDAMLPITNFARIYALKGKITETNTLRRLEALHAAGVLSKSTHLEMTETFSKLMALRLRHQAAMLREGVSPNNSVDPRFLTSFDKAMLKHALSTVSTMLKKVSFDFLGGSV